MSDFADERFGVAVGFGVGCGVVVGLSVSSPEVDDSHCKSDYCYY